MNRLPLARYLDHAVLKPDLTRDEAAAAIRLGVTHQVYSVCVRPCDIALAQDLCRNTQTAVCVVLAFPHGVTLSENKADEARRYVDRGVAEIDMVANYGLIRSHDWALVARDIEAVSAITQAAKVPLKVIVETAVLNLEQIATVTGVCAQSGAQFIKTSTGFNGEGATEAGVRTMLQAAAGRIAVKASGGIRDRQRAELFLDLGCTRLGVGYSSTPALCGPGL